jgi:hypothetical protein
VYNNQNRVRGSRPDALAFRSRFSLSFANVFFLFESQQRERKCELLIKEINRLLRQDLLNLTAKE